MHHNTSSTEKTLAQFSTHLNTFKTSSNGRYAITQQRGFDLIRDMHNYGLQSNDYMKGKSQSADLDAFTMNILEIASGTDINTNAVHHLLLDLLEDVVLLQVHKPQSVYETTHGIASTHYPEDPPEEDSRGWDHYPDPPNRYGLEPRGEQCRAPGRADDPQMCNFMNRSGANHNNQQKLSERGME